MKVADVAQKRVDSISPDDTLKDAAKRIFSYHHSGLPVVGKNRKLVGFITEQDITSQLFPTVQEFMEDYVHEHDFEAMEKKVSGVLQMKVKKAMNKKPVTIRADEPLLKAESLMKIKDIRRLPVVDKNGRLVGILSKQDVFRVLVGPKLAEKLAPNKK